MGNRSTPIYDDSPFDTVTSSNSFTETENGFDLEADLQVVSHGHIARLDFCSYAYYTTPEEAKQAFRDLQKERDGFTRFRRAVDEAHDEFLRNAEAAREVLKIALESES